MPYVIVKSKKGNKEGYRVRSEKRDDAGRYHYFSKEPLTKEMADKQRKAILISEFGRKKK